MVTYGTFGVQKLAVTKYRGYQVSMVTNGTFGNQKYLLPSFVVHGKQKFVVTKSF